MKDIWERLRVSDAHIIRPNLIAIAEKRIFQEAVEQLSLCDKNICNAGTGNCDDSCIEARDFITNLKGDGHV